MSLDVKIQGDTYIVNDGFNEFIQQITILDNEEADNHASNLLACALVYHYQCKQQFKETRELLRKKFKEYRRKQEIDGDFK